MAGSLRRLFMGLVEGLTEACQRVYGGSLVSLVIYGSVARGTPNPRSDVDVLIVVDNLPHGRLRRVEQFRAVESELEQHLDALARQGVFTTLSPLIKTPCEVQQGSPLFFDMVDHARVLIDREGFFGQYLEDLGRRLRDMGAYRVHDGDRWYWVLRPHYRPGEVFDV